MTRPATLAPRYFDAMYAAAGDPWGLRDRWYERRKYAISLALLPAERYRRGFEPGCSVGVLTRLLAGRCGEMLAWDVAAEAVRSAAAHTRDLPNVRVEQRDLTATWPPGRFDLIVLSEVLYYLGDPDLGRVLGRAVPALEPGGTLLAVHWRHPVADYPRSGDDVHRMLAERPGLARLTRHEEPDFLAEVYLRADGAPVSVAQATGLV